MLDNEDQLDNILIEMKIHKDDFLIVIVEEDEQLEAKDTNFDEDLAFIEDWIANPKEVEDDNLHFKCILKSRKNQTWVKMRNLSKKKNEKNQHGSNYDILCNLDNFSECVGSQDNIFVPVEYEDKT